MVFRTKSRGGKCPESKVESGHLKEVLCHCYDTELFGGGGFKFVPVRFRVGKF